MPEGGTGQSGDSSKKYEPLHLDAQKSLIEAFNRRTVRLDVYLDDGKSVYNLEMQTTRHAALPKRARLYQAHMDINQLQRGQFYTKLRPSFVIFICTFDPLMRGGISTPSATFAGKRARNWVMKRTNCSSTQRVRMGRSATRCARFCVI